MNNFMTSIANGYTKIVEWIRSLFMNKTDINQALQVQVNISAPMATALQLWSQMYVNQAGWLINDIKSLSLPAAIAGEIARAVTIEMNVQITGSARAEFLNAQFTKLVLGKLRDQVEYGCAKGGLMLKPWWNGTSLGVDFVQADCFFPVTFDGSENMTACVFSDTRAIGANFYTRLEYHTLTKAGYQIRNAAFKSQSPQALGTACALSEVADWAALQEQATIIGVVQPLFAYFKYPLANAIDPTSPLGVSCYSRAVDLIEQADKQWDGLLWEMESGKRAIDVDELAFTIDANGKPILPNRRLYRTYKGSGAQLGSGKSDLFQEWSPTLREQNIINTLEAILQRIEFTTGLASGTLSSQGRGATVALTATEIATSAQRTYATIVDCQKSLQAALDQLIYAMDVWTGLGNLAPKGTYEATYEFDDSIVTDHDAQFTQDSQAVGMNVMSAVEFRMRNYGESLEQAKKMLALVATEQQSAADLMAQQNPVGA